jgi:hypothetical protein
MKPSVIPNDLKGKALYDFVVKNEALIFHAKKSEIKKADALVLSRYFVDEKGTLTSKAITDAPVIAESATRLKLDVVINTTNYFDSHWDVHIPGIWNKSLADNRKNGFYLLERHGSSFRDVIGEGMKGTAQKLSWKDLGFDFTGITEALVFSGVIDKSRNEFMFDQYAKGYVKQHSVGMRYVKMVTCINDDDYPVQKENWDKYIKMVVNADEAEAEGIFWAVLEAKVNEGSAVLFGSNDLTPCMNAEDATEIKDLNQTDKEDTLNQPPLSTEEKPPVSFSLCEAIKATTFY